MAAAARPEVQRTAETTEREGKAPSLLDQVLNATTTQKRVTPFLATAEEYGRFSAAVRLAAQKNPDILQCTPVSIQAALARAAQMGLEIGVTVHLIPYNVNVAPKGQTAKWEKQLSAIADYTGLIELMVASRAVRHIEPPRIVYAGDEFREVLGSAAELHHIPCGDKAKRGTPVGAYLVAYMPYGVRTWYYMPLGDAETPDTIEFIRQKYSKQWKGGACPPWYMRKCVVRQFAKYIPKNPKLAKVLGVVELDEQEEFGETLERTIRATEARADEREDSPPPATSGAPDPADVDRRDNRAKTQGAMEDLGAGQSEPAVIRETPMGEEWQDDTDLVEG